MEFENLPKITSIRKLRNTPASLYDFLMILIIFNKIFIATSVLLLSSIASVAYLCIRN